MTSHAGWATRGRSSALVVALLGLAPACAPQRAAPPDASVADLPDAALPDAPDASPASGLLRVVKTGPGSVFSAPAGIDCGSSCSATFFRGSTIALVATAAAGGSVGAWSGCTVVSSRCDVVIAAAGETLVTVAFDGAAPPPAAPTGVSAVGGTGELTLSWGAVAGARQYAVYLASQSGVRKDTYAWLPDGARHPALASPTTITGLAGGRTYFAVVTAEGPSSESAESAQVSALVGRSRLWWASDAGGAIYYSSPAVAPDGTIYVGTGAPFASSGLVRGLTAFNPDGSQKWGYVTGVPLFSPAVGADGTVYVQGSAGALHAIKPDGALRWLYSPAAVTSNVGQTTPALAADGTIYVGSDTLYAVHADGTLAWKWIPAACSNCLMQPDAVRSSPAIRGDGSVVFAVNGTFFDGASFAGSVVVALAPTGAELWLYFNPGSTFSSPAIGADGAIYIGTERAGTTGSDSVLALNADGTLRWRFPVSGGRAVRSSPSLGAGGEVYVGVKASATAGGMLLALDSAGAQQWTFPVTAPGISQADVYSSPVVGADGTIYFGAETGLLYALHPDGTLAWTYATGNGINWTSPALTDAGTLYIGNNDGLLFSVRSDSPGVAASAWPRFHHDAQSTGRAGP